MIDEMESGGKGNFRYLVCFITWLSIFSLFTQRFNLPIAIIGMVDREDPGRTYSDHCPSTNKNKILVVDNRTQKFDWDEKKQNYLLLAFNVGYLIGLIPGGLLSIKYGPRIVMIFSLFISTGLTMASVPAANNFWLFFVIRSLMGLANGPLLSIIHRIIANYAPNKERTRLLLFTHTGTILSLVVLFPSGGYLLQYVENGWKCIFYGSGLLGTISLILWSIFVFSLPEENHWMSKVEQNFIVRSNYPNRRQPQKTISDIPIRSILTSRHIYILACAHSGKLFILYMNLLGVVKYLFTYYDLTRPMAANLAVIPFLIDFFSHLIYPKFVEFLRNKRIPITKIRKLNTLIGAFGSSVFLMVAGFIPCNDIPLGIVVLSLSLMFLPAYQAGYFTAIIELAPQYCDINIAIINVGGSFSGVVQRYITALLVTNITDIRLAYRYSFILTAFISFSLSMIYIVFGTADLQLWANKENYYDLDIGQDKEESELSPTRA